MAQQTAVEYFDAVNKLANENQGNKAKKQTAVEWLWRWMMDNPFASFEDGVKAYNQAKSMEKEQIKEAFKFGVHEGFLTDINYLKCDKDAEYYYNETYNK